MGYKLIGLIKGNKLVWEKLDVSELGEDVKMRWYNRESGEMLTSYRFNRVVNFEEFECLWGKN